MRYLMFIKHTEDYRNQEVPAGLYEAMGEFVGAGLKSGAIIDTAGLKTHERWQPRPPQRPQDHGDRWSLHRMDLHLQHWPAFEGECEVRPIEDQG